MDIGKTIKRLRKERGCTQEQLGMKLGVQKSAVQKYENGTIKNIKQDTITKLCKIFDVSPTVFLDVLYDTDRLSRETKVLDEIQILFGEPALTLLECFYNLNTQGKSKLINYAKDLTELEKYNT